MDITYLDVSKAFDKASHPANYSHCCNNTVLVGTYWLDSRVFGGTSCNLWSAPRFDLRPHAVSLICEFAARRCEIKSSRHLCR